MTQDISYHTLREALALPGCAICHLKADAADRFLDGLLWESVNDPGLRDKIRQSRGFCHQHAWRMVHNGASLGATIIMRDVMQGLLNSLGAAEFQGPPALSLRRAHEVLQPEQPSAATVAAVAHLESEAPCPVCVQADKMERIYVQTLVDNLLGEANLIEAYRASDGLCLPHFRQALARIRRREAFQHIVAAQETIWQRLVDQLAEIIRKSDYRFQHEPRGAETGACVRSIAATVGTSPDKD